MKLTPGIWIVDLLVLSRGRREDLAGSLILSLGLDVFQNPENAELKFEKLVIGKSF